MHSDDVPLHVTDGYEPELGAVELDAALGQLVGCRRRCEWLLCRYLADLADRGRFRELGGYADVLHYARRRLGLGVKTTRERLRIGRALRALPCPGFRSVGRRHADPRYKRALGPTPPIARVPTAFHPARVRPQPA